MIKQIFVTLLLAIVVTNSSIKPQEITSAPVNINEARCLAQNIYFEARGESKEGQVAVAMVTLNRVRSELFPASVCGVVRERSKSNCQFSWWCNARLKEQAVTNQIANSKLYLEIKQLAIDIISQYDEIEDITHGALFYHATYTSRRNLGRMRLISTTTIGQHTFYRIK
jgi:spore germination cell wall hydrolase CwlJ-like protein